MKVEFESELEVIVKATFRPGTPPTMYARNGDPGDPGDPHEVEIESVTVGGVDILAHLPEAVVDRLYAQVIEEAEGMDYYE